MHVHYRYYTQFYRKKSFSFSFHFHFSFGTNFHLKVNENENKRLSAERVNPLTAGAVYIRLLHCFLAHYISAFNRYGSSRF